MLICLKYHDESCHSIDDSADNLMFYNLAMVLQILQIEKAALKA
jgi:hypothetical protein